MSDTIKATLWMTGAIASFTSMAVAGRAISFELDTFEIMMYRSIWGFIVVVTVAAYFGTLGQVDRRNLGLHGLRNIFHFSGQNLWFYAITVIPLAQVFALEFTAPLWAILLSVFILGEHLTLRKIMVGLAGFAGILIVARPSPETMNLGIICAAVAAIGFAGSAVFTRRLTRTASITCILFWMTAMQIVFGIICAGFDGDIAVPSGQSLPWLILIGCAGLLAHLCLTTALKLAPASIVMPIDFARLPIVALIGMLFYAEPLDPWVFAGAALIVGANYYNIRRETRPRPATQS